MPTFLLLKQGKEVERVVGVKKMSSRKRFSSTGKPLNMLLSSSDILLIILELNFISNKFKLPYSDVI